MLQQDGNKQIVNQRLNGITVFIVIAFLVLVTRLWYLQILQGNYYTQLAERNRVRLVQVVAPRGPIFDRHRRPLVENRSAFNILLYREAVRDMKSTAEFVIQRLRVKPEDFYGRLHRSRSTGLYRPVVVKEDVGIDDISVVEAFKREHPEIQLGPEPRRFYRYGKLAAHVFGYVGEISEEELLRETFPRSRTGDLVGKSGAERTYNEILTGKDGRKQVLVDSLGREMGLLEEVDAVIGGELQLTLDLDLQMTAEELLRDKVGSAVVIDANTGEILAMASTPSFDPNTFSTRISEEEWSKLVQDPNKPLQNRSIQNSYSPGSTFKIIMALAGLDEGQIRNETRVFCSGTGVFYGRVFQCWYRQGHGFMNLDNAIARSCNVFFYELGRRLGIDKIARQAQLLGLGERTNIDLPGERSGLMPSPEWKQSIRRGKWFPGETISVAIGQGAVSVTPLQLARAVGAVVNDGKLVTPHVLLRAEPNAGEGSTGPAVSRLPIDPEYSRKIRDGMWLAVNNFGTGHRAALPGLDVCGKTGTSQVVGNEKRKESRNDPAEWEDHSWFVGFANRDEPEIVVTVFVEHGGKGGAASAPLARELFKVYFDKKSQRDGGSREPEQISEVRR